MSYATLRDVLFALDLSDSELPEERGERRRAYSLGASMRSPAAMVSPSMTIAEPVTSADDGHVARGLKSKKTAA